MRITRKEWPREKAGVWFVNYDSWYIYDYDLGFMVYVSWS